MPRYLLKLAHCLRRSLDLRRVKAGFEPALTLQPPHFFSHVADTADHAPCFRPEAPELGQNVGETTGVDVDVSEFAGFF